MFTYLVADDACRGSAQGSQLPVHTPDTDLLLLPEQRHRKSRMADSW